MNQEGAFQGTHSTVAVPYDYGEPSSSTGTISPELLRKLFQWSDYEEEAFGYISSDTISSVRMGLISANMADNNNDDFCQRMEAQEQTFRLSKKPCVGPSPSL